MSTPLTPDAYLEALADQREDVERLHRSEPPTEPRGGTTPPLAASPRRRYLTDDERRRGLARLAEIRAQLEQQKEHRQW